jgi:hypothetical protein
MALDAMLVWKGHMMAKIVFKKLAASAAQMPEPKKTGQTASIKALRSLNLDNANQDFGRELTSVFKQSVAKARRENKKATGALDSVPVKR